MYQKICIICNKEFEARTSHKTTCSVECRKKYSKEYHRKLYIEQNGSHSGLCEFCGNPIIGARQKRYCSDKCNNKADYQRNNPLIDKICPCGKYFQSRVKNTIYCSPGCVNRFCKKNDDVILICKECNKEFIKPYIKRDKQFCSRSCATIHQNKVMFSDEIVKEKISQSQKERYKIYKHPWIGRSHSEETKRKISETHIENETFKGENNPMYGVKRSSEFKEKLSNIVADRWLKLDKNLINPSKIFTTGFLYSSKINKEIYYRSSYEKIVYEFLDKNEEILTFIPEPFSISYINNGETHKRNYIPDILITYKSGIQKLIEIKPKSLLIYGRNQSKFKAAQEYCASKGLIFEIWTEETIKNMNIPD